MLSIQNVLGQAVRLHQAGKLQEAASLYRQVLLLDPFPYSGGLTTCESLWMGVPVVTWPGARFASRHSLSHLSNAGFTETIARDPGEYESIAIESAKDRARLSRLRSRLRDQTAASPLCDARRFTRDFERAMQAAWQSRIEE